VTDRIIRVVVDSSGVTRGARQAEGSLRRLEGRSKGLSSGFKAAAAAATAFAASLVVREIFQAVDAYQGLQNRLRIVTDSSAELANVQERLFAISQNTRTSFEATAQLFGRSAIAADELGASQEQLLRLTEISGKALAIMGASAQESSGALRQLSQSFSSGIVRGEEFNSILEGAFPLAQAAARGFGEAGISVGKLRTLVIEGKVSSQEFFEAILKGGEGIDEQFAKTEATLSQATQTISNSFLNLVGKMNDTTGAGQGLAKVLLAISDGIDDFTKAITGTLQPTDELSKSMKVIATTAIIVGGAFEGLSLIFDATFGAAVRGVLDLLGALAESFAALITGDFARVGEIFDELGAAAAKDFQEGFGQLGPNLIKNSEQIIKDLEQIWDAGSREIAEAIDLGGGPDGGDVTIIPTNVQEDVDDAIEAVQKFQDALSSQRTVLELQKALGEDAAEGIRQYKENLALANAENEIFKDLAPTDEVEALRVSFLAFAEEALTAQRALREEIENESIRQSFQDQIEALEEEVELLGADNEALAINAELRALAGGATAEQAERIRELTEELLNGQDALAESADKLGEFFEDARDSAQNTLAGILADPMSEGLDELPLKFAQTLQQLAADALASEIFDIIGGIASGGAAGGGGAGGIFASLFGGGFQAGGQVRGGQPILVGERGPELFTPPGSGSIQPNISINQAAQAAPNVTINNITDPADIPAGLNTAEGNEAVMNIIQRNPDAVKRVVGG
jgi:tape measure domain-containing protein